MQNIVDLLPIIFPGILLVFLYCILYLSKSKPSKTTPSPQIPHTFISNQLNNINVKLESLIDNSIPTTKTQIETLKTGISQIKQDILNKTNLKESKKHAVISVIESISNKFNLIQQQCDVTHANLINEKNNLEKRLAELQQQHLQSADTCKSQSEHLKNILSELQQEMSKFDSGVLKVDVSNFKSDLQNLQSQLDTQTVSLTGKLDTKNTAHKTAEYDLDIKLKQLKNNKIHSIKKLDADILTLQNQIQTFKKELDTNILTSSNTALQNEKEITELNKQIEQINNEKGNYNNLIKERNQLQLEIVDIKENIKLQQHTLNQKIDERDEQINHLKKELEIRETSMTQTWKEEENQLLKEKEALEKEINTLKNQLERTKHDNKTKENELKKILKSIQNELSKKQSEFTDISKERQKLEQQIRNKLNKQLISLKDKINNIPQETKTKLKHKDDEIYTIKARMATREDKLQTDIVQRKETQKRIIDKLKESENMLRNLYQKQSAEFKRQIQPSNDQIGTIKSNIKNIVRQLNQEHTLLSKLKKESNRLEQEISLIEHNFSKSILELHTLINLKQNYVNNISQQIIEQDHLFETEQSVRHELKQIEQKIKPNQ